MKRRRKLLTGFSLVSMVAGLVVAVGPIAEAATPIFRVMNTSEAPPDGVYFRKTPHTADAIRITGFGVYRNERVQLQCYAWGDSVGRYHDKLWYYVKNVSRRTVAGRTNQGYLNAHYINDGKNANVVDAGVAKCGTKPAPPSVQPCLFNMRWATNHLTFSYNGAHIYYGNAWQAAKNWTDLNTGITVNPTNFSTIPNIVFRDMDSSNYGFYAQAGVPYSWAVPVQRSVPTKPHHPSVIYIDVNHYWMKQIDDYHRTFALTHELGHALGLAHPDEKCGIKDTGIMDAGHGDTSSKTFNTPQFYDKIELEELYGLRRG